MYPQAAGWDGICGGGGSTEAAVEVGVPLPLSSPSSSGAGATPGGGGCFGGPDRVDRMPGAEIVKPAFNKITTAIHFK